MNKIQINNNDIAETTLLLISIEAKAKKAFLDKLEEAID